MKVKSNIGFRPFYVIKDTRSNKTTKTYRYLDCIQCYNINDREGKEIFIIDYITPDNPVAKILYGDTNEA